MVEDLLTVEDWKELTALKDAISYNPASVSPEKMEQFTDLFVKSLYGKGDRINLEFPSNY